MKPLPLIQQATPAFTWQMTACETCGGEGTQAEFRRFAGEYQAGEPVDVVCQDCDGSGEEEASCECGEIAPLNDEGLCANCVFPAELRAETKGQWL